MFGISRLIALSIERKAVSVKSKANVSEFQCFRVLCEENL